MLTSIDDDYEVRNHVSEILRMDRNTSDMQIQKVLIERFGEKYPGMKLNDWRHIIEQYTSILRNKEIRTPDGKIIEVFPMGDSMAAEPNKEPKED